MSVRLFSRRSYVARLLNLARGAALDPRRPNSNACRERVIQSKMGSNPYRLSYGSETWWVERSSDAEDFEGRFKVTRGHPRSNSLLLLYGFILGGWSQILMPNILKVSSRSSEVTRGKMVYHLLYGNEN